MLFLLVATAGYMPGYPFAEHQTWMQGPEGHTYTDEWNHDIDCRFSDGVGTVVSGTVELVVDDQPRGGPTHTGYGNRVCVREPTSGYLLCHNHLDEGTVSVSVGDVLVRGDRIGNCGNSGYSEPLGGPGDHLDVYAVDRDGNNVELAHPDEWQPYATLAEPGPDLEALKAEAESRAREVEEALEFGNLRRNFYEKHEEDACDVNYDWRPSDPKHPGLGDSVLELAVDQDDVVHRVVLLTVSQSGDTVRSSTWTMRADGTPLRLQVEGTQYNASPPEPFQRDALIHGGQLRCEGCTTRTVTLPEIGELPSF